MLVLAILIRTTSAWCQQQTNNRDIRSICFPSLRHFGYLVSLFDGRASVVHVSCCHVLLSFSKKSLSLFFQKFPHGKCPLLFPISSLSIQTALFSLFDSFLSAFRLDSEFSLLLTHLSGTLLSILIALSPSFIPLFHAITENSCHERCFKKRGVNNWYFYVVSISFQHSPSPTLNNSPFSYLPVSFPGHPLQLEAHLCPDDSDARARHPNLHHISMGSVANKPADTSALAAPRVVDTSVM